jgi:NO-binding membrane sensor protein with MHYT domain
MNASAASAVADSSLLMWLLAAITAIMTASICQGWLRQAQLRPTLRKNWKASLISAAVLGTGFTTAVVLGLAAEALPFPLGYRLRDAPLLWLGSMVAFWPPLALLGCRFRWPAVIAGGLMLGLVTVSLPLGWVSAAGFRPGITWRFEAGAVAAFAAVAGMCFALLLMFSESAYSSRRRSMVRLGAALLMSLTVLASQQMLMAGTNLSAQVGSVFRTEVPSSLLCLVMGVLVPLLWSLLLLDLRLRRQEQRRLERRDKRSRRHQESLARESLSPLTRPAQALTGAPASASASASEGMNRPTAGHQG